MIFEFHRFRFEPRNFIWFKGCVCLNMSHSDPNYVHVQIRRWFIDGLSLLRIRLSTRPIRMALPTPTRQRCPQTSPQHSDFWLLQISKNFILQNDQVPPICKLIGLITMPRGWNFYRREIKTVKSCRVRYEANCSSRSTEPIRSNECMEIRSNQPKLEDKTEGKIRTMIIWPVLRVLLSLIFFVSVLELHASTKMRS